MAELNLVGQRLDIKIRQGTDSGIITFSIQNEDLSLVDISGHSVTGSIYRNSDKNKMADWAVSKPDNYHFSISLTHEQYQDLATTNEDHPIYFHEVNLISGETIMPFVYGDFISLWGAMP